MSINISCTPASPKATKDFCRIDLTGLTLNDSTAYDATKYPTEPEVRYYLTFEVGGAVVGKSQVFASSPDGKFTFNNYIFPKSGSYTVRLSDAADVSQATKSVTVS